MHANCAEHDNSERLVVVGIGNPLCTRMEALPLPQWLLPVTQQKQNSNFRIQPNKPFLLTVTSRNSSFACFRTVHHIIAELEQGGDEVKEMPADRPARRFRANPARSGRGPGDSDELAYTCCGCGLSFSKKGLDVHRSHRFAKPTCLRAFEEAQRLSVEATSRDFRVTGRAPNRPRADVGAGHYMLLHALHAITCITCHYTLLHALHTITRNTCHYMHYMPLHALNANTCITCHYT